MLTKIFGFRTKCDSFAENGLTSVERIRLTFREICRTFYEHN